MAKGFKTKITEMLNIEHPILCGGMNTISKSDFVSKVCNAGGLGFITAETFETPELLREDLRKMRTLTDKPFGVNISMIPEFDVGERTLRLTDVVCEEGVDVVETAGEVHAGFVQVVDVADQGRAVALVPQDLRDRSVLEAVGDPPSKREGEPSGQQRKAERDSRQPLRIGMLDKG